MFFETMRSAIAGARTLAQLDELARETWRAHAGGAVDDAAAQGLAELAHERRGVVRGEIRPVGIPAGRASLFPPRRPPASPDRQASKRRRRLLAASGPMPPALAAGFTTGQLAVLRIVGDEVATKGVCGLCVDAIAARAGVCRRLAQGALRLAAGDGLVTIQERRHEGRKNSPNLVRIVSREWSAWLRRARRPAAPMPSAKGAASAMTTGCKTLRPTDRALQTKPVPGVKEERRGLATGSPAGARRSRAGRGG